MPEDEPLPEELLAVEAADAYLDALGNKRDFDGDQLGATEWRKDVDAEPLDMSRLPTAHTTRGELPPTTGGTMSQLSDLADAVGGNADVQEVLAAVAQAAQVLQNKKTAVMALLADTAHAGAVEGAFGSAEQHLDACLGPINVVGEAIGSAAGAIRGGS